MALAFVLGRQFFIVLDEENIERITHHDPFELTPRQTGNFIVPLPLDLVVAYATKAEYAHLKTLSPRDVVEYLNRGYQFTATDAERLKEPPREL